MCSRVPFSFPYQRDIVLDGIPHVLICSKRALCWSCLKKALHKQNALLFDNRRKSAQITRNCSNFDFPAFACRQGKTEKGIMYINYPRDDRATLFVKAASPKIAIHASSSFSSRAKQSTDRLPRITLSFVTKMAGN